jgi:hypothetical protein
VSWTKASGWIAEWWIGECCRSSYCPPVAVAHLGRPFAAAQDRCPWYIGLGHMLFRCDRRLLKVLQQHRLIPSVSRNFAEGTPTSLDRHFALCMIPVGKLRL